jgi:hypothetical protein
MTNKDLQLIFLGSIAERFYCLYGNASLRCVDVSADFLKYITKLGFSACAIREIIKFKSGKNTLLQEHSWCEVYIGNKTYVIDITGKQQFGLEYYFYHERDYLKLLKKALEKTHSKEKWE